MCFQHQVDPFMSTHSSSNINEVVFNGISYPSTLNVLQPQLASITDLNQPNTFLLIIEMFVQQYESFKDDVKHAILTNNGPELHSLIHTLKGSSGALGLQNLNEITTELDLQLTQRVDIDSLNLADLYRCIKLSIVDCKKILELNSHCNHEQNNAHADSKQDQDLSVLLITLRQKLHNHELITQPFIELLRRILDDQNNRRYDQVIALINEFEYSKAYQSLIEID